MKSKNSWGLAKVGLVKRSEPIRSLSFRSECAWEIMPCVKIKLTLGAVLRKTEKNNDGLA